MRPIVQSRKLQHVRYDVRGPILVEAQRLEAEGHKILKLNIGNPAPFGFEAPEAIVADIVHNLPESQGYSDSRGIYSARTAVAQYYQARGLTETVVDDVYIGNGVSELITMVLQAFLDDGNEILVPAPDYPLWTGAVTLSGGTPVHYRCDEENGWDPDLSDIEAKITPQTQGLVIINPNNPTGAVYSEETVRGLVDIARRHELVVFSDEIYEKILFDDAVHHHTAAYAGRRRALPDLQRAVQGLPRVRLPRRLGDGLRPAAPGDQLPRGADPAREHADVPQRAGPARDPDRARRLPVDHEYIVPGGRFHEQSKTAWRLLNEIPGVSCTEPRGALYCFPRLDPDVYHVKDDEDFVIGLLRAKKILVTHGTGFNWFEPDHFRLVTLPDVDTLTDAIGRIADHLATLR